VPRLALAVLALGLTAAYPTPVRAVEVLVEDWTRQEMGATGVPSGWMAYPTIGGRPRYDFAVVEEDGHRALHVKARDEHSTIAREVVVDLKVTPILEWTWKIVRLPAGADIRRKDASDLTAHLLAVWPRTPAWLRSRLIGYVWDEHLPVQHVEPSRKTGTVTFLVVRSGLAQLNQWVTERRDVSADYAKLYGGEPDNPRALAISIDTNDTHSAAEAYIGRIAFSSRAPEPTR
jgi:hypothetical protein